MENLIWARTILNVYNNIEKYILKIDSLINNVSLMPELRVDDVTKRIIELSDRKVALINLKIVVETLIANCKQKYLRFLSLRYIQKLTMEEISEHLKICERTCYRLYSEALDNFILNMKYYGYTSKWLYENLKEEKWILHEFYKEYKKQEKIEVEKEEKKLHVKNAKKILLTNQFHKNLS